MDYECWFQLVDCWPLYPPRFSTFEVSLESRIRPTSCLVARFHDLFAKSIVAYVRDRESCACKIYSREFHL